MEDINKKIKAFLRTASDDEELFTGFGYLLVPDDERLNAEAMSILKKKFKEFSVSD
jgi:hypothetical protein